MIIARQKELFGFGSSIANVRVFRYRSIKSVRVFLHFRLGLSIFSLGSDISDLTEKTNNIFFLNHIILAKKIVTSLAFAT